MKKFWLIIMVLIVSAAGYLNFPLSAAERSADTSIYTTDATVSGGHSFNGTYGYEYLGTMSNGEAMQSLYSELNSFCAGFYYSQDDISATTAGYYVAGTFDISELGLSQEEAVIVWGIFKYDNPLYYWISGEVTISGGSKLNLCIYKDYSIGSTRAQTTEAVESGIAGYISELSSCSSAAELAIAAHDKIISDIDYAYSDGSGIPDDSAASHSIVGVFTKTGAVCEGYARSYQIILNYFGIENIYICGTGNSDIHAWNMVKLGGEWYWVDVTWDDIGSYGKTYTYFGADDDFFGKSHVAFTPQNDCTQFLYSLPEASNSRFCPVNLYYDGAYSAEYYTIEAALADISDPDGDYKIMLNTEGFLNVLPSGALPAAKSITFAGQCYKNGEHYNSTPLYFSSNVSPQSDLIFDNVWLNTEAAVSDSAKAVINAKGNMIIFTGTYCQSGAYYTSGELRSVSVYGDDATVIFDTSIYTYIYGNIKVNTISVKTGTLAFFGSDISSETLNIGGKTQSIFIYDNYGSYNAYFNNVVFNDNINHNIYTNNTKPGNRITLGSISGAASQLQTLSVYAITGSVSCYPEIAVTGIISSRFSLHIDYSGSGDFTREYAGKYITAPKWVMSDDVNTTIYCNNSTASDNEKLSNMLFEKDAKGNLFLKGYGFEITYNVLTDFRSLTWIKEIEIPQEVYTIGEDVFRDQENIEKINLPGSITKIENNAFSGCINLSIIYFSGSRGNFQNIQIGDGNECFSKAAIFCDEDIVKYNVTWIVDGNYYSMSCISGTIPSFYGSTEKQDDGLRTYIFTGWSPDVKAVTGDISYTAVYTARFKVPEAPTISSVSATRVTLVAINGYEYSKNGQIWQKSNLFTGLSANTQYTFYQRVMGQGDTSSSSKSQGTQASTLKSETKSPPAPEIMQKTDTTIVLEIYEGCEYSKNGVTWQSGNVFSGLKPETYYTFYCRIKETDSSKASGTSPGTSVKTEKKSDMKSVPDIPAAPEVISFNDNSVTLKAVSGYEYSKDKIIWQTSEVFNYLNPNTYYNFYCRAGETLTEYASTASSGVAVKTKSLIPRKITSTFYDIDQEVNIISGILVGTTVNELISHLNEGQYVKVYSKDGKEVPKNSQMTEEMTVQLMFEKNIICKYSLKISNDDEIDSEDITDSDSDIDSDVEKDKDDNDKIIQDDKPSPISQIVMIVCSALFVSAISAIIIVKIKSKH